MPWLSPAHWPPLPAGDIATLPPLTYPLGSAAASLRQLAAARHVGKVVAADSSACSTAAGRWVISGGTGALGSLAAQWLVAGGARHVALLGRTGLADTAGTGPMDVLGAATVGGAWAAAVTLIKCDAAAAADAQALLQTAVGSGEPRLPWAGVLHAGGVLRDATLANQTLAGLRAVLAPKASGTARLATSAGAALQPLAAVQLFSSVAAALGSGGQANYAAANALLDAAADGMQQRGLPGAAVAWGAWMGADMAAHAGVWAGEGQGPGVASRAPQSLPTPWPPALLPFCPLQAWSAWSDWALVPSAQAPAWRWCQPCCALAPPAPSCHCRLPWWPLCSIGTRCAATARCSQS